MYNLILKDMLIQKKMFIWGFAYILLMTMAFQSTGGAMFPAGVMALTYILAQTACASDDKNKTDIMLNSLPLSRESIVLARYISIFVFATIGIIYYLVVALIINNLAIPFKVTPVTIEGILAALFAVVFINGIYFPIFFKVGYIKARIINFVLFFGVFFGIGAMAGFVKENLDMKYGKEIVSWFQGQPDAGIAALIILIMSVMFWVSYLLSVKFYRAREF